MYHRIDIKKFQRETMKYMMKMKTKQNKINRFQKVLKSNQFNHSMHKYKWKKILKMKILHKNQIR